MPFLKTLLVLGLSVTAIQAELISDTNAQSAALKIDKFIATGFRKKKIQVPPLVNDTTFLRRSFLSIAGRIPTLDEIRFFVDAEDENKRDLMINYLLESPGYNSHMTNWLADIFRLKDRPIGNPRRTLDPYIFFFRDAVADNMPWDEMTNQLLASNGTIWTTPAVGYYVRDKAMEKDNLANSMRIFTGVRMECAQCHDHPFDQWQQKEFYELVAFVDGQHEVDNRAIWKFWRSLANGSQGRSPMEELAGSLYDQVTYSSVGGGGRGRTELPSDYKESGGKPGEIVAARSLYGKQVRGNDKTDSGKGRDQFAEWITGDSNTHFAQTVANRLWQRVMGTGLYEPIDEYVRPDKTAHPDLLRYLSKLMQDLDYDTKSFQKVLFYTHTYQFDSNPKELALGKPDYFNGRQLRRLSPEQLWDSLITLQKGNPDSLPTRELQKNLILNGKPVLVGQKDLAEISRDIAKLKTQEEAGAYTRQLMEMIRAESPGNGGNSSMMGKRAEGRGGLRGFVRASELEYPAPADHLLREFGQSDRELIEGNSTAANVSQILNLLNGHVQDHIIDNPSISLFKMLEAYSSPQDRIRGLFLSILTRPPSDEEMALMLGEVERLEQSSGAYQNIAAALLCTHEFLFLK